MNISKSYFILDILLIIAVLFGARLYYLLTAAHAHEASLTESLAQRTQEYTKATNRITELEDILTETKGVLEQTLAEKSTLQDDLTTEKDRNDEFERQIRKINSTVGTLDKLSKTDPELLAKYSKIYFLNENYMPEKLVEIPKQYLYNEEIPKFIHAEVKPFLIEMIEDALDDGVKLWIVSAFRSFDEQADLKGKYTVSYGSGANAFSADQGYSEHQLGTTIDFTAEGLGGGLTGFDTTPAYEWLLKHAYKYGFVPSYPHDNTYYVFEPWHWRFVGRDLARDLHDDGAYFYDLNQREIDAYLISIFD